MINLFLIDYYDRKNSGLATYITQLSNHFGNDFHIALHLILVNATGRRPYEKEEVDGQMVYHVPFDLSLQNNSRDRDQLIDFFVNETANKEHVVFHFNWINHAPFAQLLKKSINCKTVLTKHCIPWRDLVTDRYPMFRRLDQRLIGKESADYLAHVLAREHAVYYSVDHVICVTHFASHALQRMFRFPQEKITVIHNGLDFKKPTQRSKEELKADYGFDSDERLILYAGNVHMRKGTYGLVSAFDRILNEDRRARLIIAGGGDYSGVFKNAHKNWSKITLTGDLDKETLYDFYQMADVGVIPSYVEQCSYTAIEMLYYGLPVVVSDVDGLAEIVPDDCGLKTPVMLGAKQANVDGTRLAENILFFLRNPETANQFASRANSHATQHFTAERMARETIQVYEKLLADDGAEKPTVKSLQDSPLVSVLIPCYNGQEHLKACVDSVLRQSYPYFELIIVDDGSIDGTAALLETYQDDRIIVIRNEGNRGIVDSLNDGIKLAQGKYVARIDADDLMHEERLYKQVQFLEDDRNAGFAMVGSHHHVIDQAGQIIGLKQYPLSHDEIVSVLLFQNPFSHPSMMIRADVLRQIRYTGKYPYAEDYHLWFRILRKYKAANLPEYLTFYRIHGNNVSTQKANEQKESVGDLLSTELDNLGISHSASDLAVHIAICAGYGPKYFHSLEKVVALDKWTDRVLRSLQRRRGYSDDFVTTMKEYVREMCCGVYV